MKRLWRWCVGGPDWNWTQAIQSLKSDRPLTLPTIKPLKAVKAKGQKRQGRVANFSRGRL